MSKTVVIHQPDFLPYLGFFHRLLYVDLYVVLDDVQFVRRGWHNRDKIKTRQGEKWITVTTKKERKTALINEMMLCETADFRGEHLRLFKENYGKSKYYSEIMPHIERLYDFKCERMMDFNMKSIDMLMELFDVTTDYIFSADLGIEGIKDYKTVGILKKLNVKHYLSGVGAKVFHQPELFKEAGIEVVFQDFKHPVYPQQFGDFISYLSSIDLLFNCGIEKSREILRSI